MRNTVLLFAVLLTACQRSPPDECRRVVATQCHKLFHCTPSNSSYATEAACVTGQQQQLRCDTWWVPDTCPFDWKTFDSCLVDYGAMACDTSSPPQSCNGVSLTSAPCTRASP